MSIRRSDQQQNAGDTSRRRYQAPRILFREPLEAIAAACVPQPPGKPDLVLCSNPSS